ncbi:hypothetical protein SU48_01990 [Deinococcus puniceus]|uniref:Uncharacterized protein n=1 Tax=Deinococcus puniceus TaxID=1182568 RepID=A0A172T6S2_9DEIO|nr:hypothetical protein SU48_01990 [Deinococcus puniceus]
MVSPFKTSAQSPGRGTAGALAAAGTASSNRLGWSLMAGKLLVAAVSCLPLPGNVGSRPARRRVKKA